MSRQSGSRHQDIFERAFAGIPRVAELIAALRLEDRIRALNAAEQRYKQMARDVGVSEGAADVWAAAVMSLIRLRVVEETFQRAPTAQAGCTMSRSPTTNGHFFGRRLRCSFRCDEHGKRRSLTPRPMPAGFLFASRKRITSKEQERHSKHQWH